MRIAVVGAGSLGTIIGALIQEGGYQVDLIDVNQENVDALNRHGAMLTGCVDKTIPVTAVHPDELEGVYDLVLLLTKQVYTKESLTSMLPFLHSDSIVCTLQNGVPEEQVADIAGSGRTIGGAVGFGATWAGPGVSELTTEPDVVKKYAFEIGELHGKRSSRIQEVQRVLETIGNCDISTNIQGVRWSKLLMNTTFSGMSAALDCTFGDILHDEVGMMCVANIADETVRVARARQVKLEKMQGKDFEMLELKRGEQPADKMDIYEAVWGPHANLRSSMLQDLKKGKKSEIDYINGYVVKKGRESGVPTPFNELVCRLVREAEKTGNAPDFHENMAVFREFAGKYVSASN
ncbi:ketopantoate reductase family protein [Salibacterium sp. K-3]